MIRARIAVWILGRLNMIALDQMTEVLCGTRKNYEMKATAPIVDVLVRRWLHSGDVK